MRFLILSDIHANWEALEAVLRHATGTYERALCLGDIVGYGADPDAATEWVRQNVGAVIRGNHDKACAGLEDLSWFNPAARASAEWTQQVTKPRNITWLRNLPKGPEPVDGFEIVHGSRIDEDEYVLNESDAAQVAPYLDTRVSFFGHTHVQGGFLCRGGQVKRLAAPARGEMERALDLDADSFYLLNPGSVGQPRDGDPRAAYAAYDNESRVVTFHRVPYDVEAAQAKIVAAGLPELLAVRLALGR